jgi:OmpA-OmpF porin, OOP family
VQPQAQAHQQQLAQQKVALQRQQLETAAAQAKIDANKTAIAEANKRFGELGGYNIPGVVTVLFTRGKTAVEAEYNPQLLQVIEKAKTVDAYVIKVKGYAIVGRICSPEPETEHRAGRQRNGVS